MVAPQLSRLVHVGQARPEHAIAGALRQSSAGNPIGSSFAKSKPLPLTRTTSSSSPNRVRITVFTDTLPPPCNTSIGSEPSSRAV